MKRRPVPEQQAALALGDEPDSEVMLRQAFAECGLARHGFTYEDWIKRDPINRKVLINVNEQKLRARRERLHA